MRFSRKYAHSRPLGHPNKKPDQKPARLADAAILIAWRIGKDAGVEVLMGRRTSRAAFLPSFYVFPGGRLDPLDYAVGIATPLEPALTRSMGVRGNKRMAQALAVAAVRETFEETGLILGANGDVGDLPRTDWQPWRSRNLAPSLQHLHYFGRAITSPMSPIRFNARFFIVHADRLEGELAGSGELSDLAFYAVGDVLQDKPIVDVTEFMLKSLISFAAEPQQFYSAAPVFSYRGLAPFIRYEKIDGITAIADVTG